MKPLIAAFFTIILTFAAWPAAQAWTNHAILTYMALDGMPGIKGSVTTETLAAFLNKERNKIGKVLEDEEAWSRKNIRDYSPRPDSLAFDASREKDIVIRFLNAVRLNPGMKAALFIQPRDLKDARPRAAWENISLYPRNYLKRPLVALRAGEQAGIAEVIATASDEPDYGYDFGLYEDNDTPYGARYGYGIQPISNPKVFTYTQAGFHMGFYHEAWIVFKAAPYLKKTCPEQRAHLYYTLARFAFETGHPYWGYRFAGMGLHYVQDLAQPFHARALPGVSTLKLLWASAVNAIGFSGLYDRLVANVTNEHMLIETLMYDMMLEKFNAGAFNDPLLAALADASGDNTQVLYDGRYLTETVSREASARAGDVIDALNGIIADRALFTRTAALDRDGKFSAEAVVAASPEHSKKHFRNTMALLMKSIGGHTRTYIREASGNK